ncbi:hypothetical protein, partial [Xylella fastidiosa]
TINAHTLTNTGTIEARHLIDINAHTMDQQASFEVTGPDATLGLSTNQAMTQTGVAISNTGPDGYTSLKATGPLHLGTLNTHRSDTTQWDPRNSRHSRHSRINTEHGTRITANGDISISADAGIT